MKDARSIGKARNARLNQTIKHATALSEHLRDFQGTSHDTPIMYADFWEVGRDLVEAVSRCLHEANAYNNVMVPDGENFERDTFALAPSAK